jgi:nicotinate-nucleotide adenylyltransferase
LDETLFVLAARPPHKSESNAADSKHRLAMLELAVAGQPGLRVSNIEVLRDGPSYSIDTLQEITRTRPAEELFFILGIDAYLDIDTWSRPELLLELANVIVTTRPGHIFPPGGLQPPVAGANACCYDPSIRCFVHSSGHQLSSCEIQDVDISASEIRRRLVDGNSIEDLTGTAVARYIHDHSLYGAHAS